MSPSSNNRFAPPVSVLADIGAVDSVAKAGRAERLGAVMIDGFLFGLPFIPSYTMALATLRATMVHPAFASIWLAAMATGAFFWAGTGVTLVLIVTTTILVHRNGQTIGKRLLGIKVVRTDGTRASLARIFWLRYFVNTLIIFVPLIGGVYSLVDALMIFGASRRCCHDHIADTIVVRA